jgi:hypothetical protein
LVLKTDCGIFVDRQRNCCAAASLPYRRAPKRGGLQLEGNAPSNYSRGEKQKPVTGSYRNNWNSIFGKKKTKP